MMNQEAFTPLNVIVYKPLFFKLLIFLIGILKHKRLSSIELLNLSEPDLRMSIPQYNTLSASDTIFLWGQDRGSKYQVGHGARHWLICHLVRVDSFSGSSLSCPHGLDGREGSHGNEPFVRPISRRLIF